MTLQSMPLLSPFSPFSPFSDVGRMVRRLVRSPWTLLLSVGLAVGLAACAADSEEHDEDHDHDDHAYHRLTTWDDELEAFARFEVHEGSGRIEGTLYLTVEGDPLARPDDDAEIGWIRLGPAGDGDETPLTLRSAGTADFELFFGERDQATLHTGLRLNGDERELELGTVPRTAEPPELAEVELRIYGKENQWLLPFAVAEAERRSVDRTARGSGRMEPDPRYALSVTAPVEGEVVGGTDRFRVATGAHVGSGDPLLELAPSLTGDGSWVGARTAYLQARDAFQRAQRLREADAISVADFQERQREYEVRRAGYERLTGGLGQSGIGIEDGGDILHLNSARAGVVTRVHAAPGRRVAEGEPLLELHDPGRLQLEAFVHPGDMDRLGPVHAIEVATGREEWLTFGEDAFEPLGTRGAYDASGTRLRLAFGLAGAEALRVGQPVQVILRSPGDEEGVAVPRSALFDEHSHKVVFVQHAGDQFERRVVEVGATTAQWATITQGLEAGDRVVVQGTYPLHLVTADIELDHGHDH